LSPARVKEIALYATDPDATFPTPIIVSASSSQTEIIDGEIRIHTSDSEDADDFMIGELLDGQHRIRGLQQADDNGSDLSGFELPVVVMLDLNPAEKAYVFSIINSKQTPVGKSLIYDLFGLSQSRSPYLTAHEVARAMNLDPEGPFYRGLKMLGRKESPTEILTQGSFVKYLLRLISKKPDRDLIAIKRKEEVPADDNLPFNGFWRDGKDELILRAMTNYFNAIKVTFPDEWNPEAYVATKAGVEAKPTPVLRRTVGYEALMRALGQIWFEAREQKNISQDFFLEKAKQFKENTKATPLTTEHFGSSSADAGRLADLLLTGHIDRA
jgi:DGQHR domain-containing protein